MLRSGWLIILQNNSADEELRGEIGKLSLILKSSNPAYEALLRNERIFTANVPTATDPIKVYLEEQLGEKVENYMVVPRKNMKKRIEELVVAVNKRNLAGDSGESFSRRDEMFGSLIASINGIVKKYRAVYNECQSEIASVAFVYRRFEELLTCVTYLQASVRTSSIRSGHCSR